jgi:hypothetical protein
MSITRLAFLVHLKEELLAFHGPFVGRTFWHREDLEGGIC